MFQAMELLKPFAPQFLIILLKSIKQLSMHTNTLSPLQLVGAIPKLIGYFNCTSGKHAKVLFLFFFFFFAYSSFFLF